MVEIKARSVKTGNINEAGRDIIIEGGTYERGNQIKEAVKNGDEKALKEEISTIFEKYGAGANALTSLVQILISCFK